MTRSTDAFASGLKQLVGNVARVDPANCPSVFVDLFGNSKCVGDLRLEYRMQKLNDEFQGSFIVIMQYKLYGPGGNVVHETPLERNQC